MIDTWYDFCFSFTEKKHEKFLSHKMMIESG